MSSALAEVYTLWVFWSAIL